MNLVVLGVDLIFARDHFFAQKLFGGVREHALLFGDVFRSEDFIRGTVFDEKAAAFWRGRLFGPAGHCCLLLLRLRRYHSTNCEVYLPQREAETSQRVARAAMP